MPVGAVIVVLVPIFVVLVVLYLRYLYGDSLFDLDWPGHDLNVERDTRIIKLNLRADEKHPNGDGQPQPKKVF